MNPVTPVDEAKATVAKIFQALQPNHDAVWHESVRGGFEARTSITSGILTGYVGNDGEYAVYAGKPSCERMITLQSGSFRPRTDSGSCANGYSPETPLQNG